MQNADRYWIGFGDIHENISALPKLAELVREAAGVIISGDLTNRGGESKARTIIEAVQALNPVVYAQIGNMDKPEVDDYFTRVGINIHARGVNLGGGVGLMGVGLSTATPFNTPSETTDAQLAIWLDEAYYHVRDLPQIILAVHNPPYSSGADRVGLGMAVGSKSVRMFIERVCPAVCLTGHIHESKTLQQFEGTTLVNPGAFGAGGYAIIRDGVAGLSVELAKV